MNLFVLILSITWNIDCYYDNKQSSDFMSMGKEIETAGILTEDKSYTFAFNRFDKQHETYSGLGIRLRYHPHPKNCHNKIKIDTSYE